MDTYNNNPFIFIVLFADLKWADEYLNNASIPGYIKRQAIKKATINGFLIAFAAGQLAFGINVIGGFLKRKM